MQTLIGKVEYFYAKDGRQLGPVPDHALKQLALAGELRRADKVWCKGMAEWQQAASVPGLFEGLPPDLKPGLATDAPPPLPTRPEPVQAESKSQQASKAEWGFWIRMIGIALLILAVYWKLKHHMYWGQTQSALQQQPEEALGQLPEFARSKQPSLPSGADGTPRSPAVTEDKEIVRSIGKLAGYWRCNNTEGMLIFQIEASDTNETIQVRAQRDFKDVPVVSGLASTNGVTWSQIHLLVQLQEQIEVEVEKGYDFNSSQSIMRREVKDSTNTYDLVLDLKTDRLTGSSSGCKYNGVYQKFSDGPVAFERISAEMAKPLDPYRYNSDVNWSSR